MTPELWAESAPVEKTLDRLVLLLLARRWNPDTQAAEARISRVAEIAGVDPRSVRRVLVRLQEAGHIEVLRSHAQGMSGTNLYGLRMDPTVLPAEKKVLPPVSASDTVVPHGTPAASVNYLALVASEAPVRQEAARIDWWQVAADLMWAAIWQAYPSKRRAAKKQCLEKFMRLTAEQQVAAYEDIVLRRRAVRDAEWLRGYSPAPVVYLNQARWEQEWEVEGDANQQRDHGRPGLRRDGNDLVTRAIEANRRRLAGE